MIVREAFYSHTKLYREYYLILQDSRISYEEPSEDHTNCSVVAVTLTILTKHDAESNIDSRQFVKKYKYVKVYKYIKAMKAMILVLHMAS